MSAVSGRVVPWKFVLDEPVRLLVVDDDPILREFASVYLATPCATIDTACDVASARALLRDNHYDIVLLDIEMPQVDGFALLEEIRASERLKDLPVIMLTGHDDIASVDRAYQLGAHSFATKPVNWRQLSYQIRYVVRMSGRAAQEAPAVVAAAKSPSEFRDLLQSTIDQAAILRDRLSAHDSTRLATLLQELAALANRMAESCRREDTVPCSDGTEHADDSRSKVEDAA